MLNLASDQTLTDLLTAERARFEEQGCPDCSAVVGEPHLVMCDVARCLECGCQRYSCDCESVSGEGDVWDGLWPGTISAYENGYTHMHRGEFGFDFGAIDSEMMLRERLAAKSQADKATLKAQHANRMSEFSVGETVEYFGVMNPLGDSHGEAIISRIGWLCEEPVCWMNGVSGAWSLYAVQKVGISDKPR